MEIKADSGVTIEYVNQNNNQPTEETVPSEPAGPSEETDIAVPTNTEPGNEDDPSDTTPNLPDGIHIPDSDIVVTVDENDNLVQADSKGNKIVLDSEKKYQIEENEDGSVKIVDADGKEVKVTDEGNVLFGDMDEEEVVDNEEKRPIILWVAVILGIAVVAVAAGFVVKKKMKKK